VVERVAAHFEALDERFGRTDGDAWLERLFADGRWTEGPAYFPAGRYLVFSDIPNDRMLRWDETTGVVGTLRQPAGYANGNSRDRLGRLLSCEHGERRVTRTEPDGSITVLADRYQGHRLNSPNDLVEHSDGSVWFTDPSYGIDTDYEGNQAESELDGCHVYRIDPGTGEVVKVADDFLRPNGLAFAADERELYITDTRRKHIRVFDVDGADRWPGARGVHGRVVRRLAARPGRTDLGRCARRPALLPSGRHAARQAARARDRLESHVRRAEAQHALHLRNDLGVCDPG
jgi:gluconolactonase